MTATETITFLRDFNRWRRGDDSIPQPQPGKATEAIDAACAHVERLEQDLHAAREQCHKLRLERAVARQFAEQMERERDQLTQALKAILFFCEEDQQFASKPYRATFLHAQKLVTRHSSHATSP